MLTFGGDEHFDYNRWSTRSQADFMRQSSDIRLFSANLDGIFKYCTRLNTLCVKFIILVVLDTLVTSNNTYLQSLAFEAVKSTIIH